MDIILSITVVAPICIYIIIGIVVKKLNWINSEGVGQSNALVYRLFFPIIMFLNIYSSNLSEAFNGRLIFYMLFMLTLVYILLYIFTPIFIKGRSVQASVILGVYRANSILFAIPIVASIYGIENISVATVCVSIVVPFTNVFSIVMLEHKRGVKVNPKKLIINVVKNPILIGAILGVLAKLINLVLPQVIYSILSDMGKVVTPLALILLGAGLTITNIIKNKTIIAYVCILKLIVIPIVFVGIGYILNFRGIELVTIFSLSAVPAAVSSYVMAKEMGADGPLAGEIVAFTSILSIITIFIGIILLTGLGWI